MLEFNQPHSITSKHVNVGDQFLVKLSERNTCVYICVGKVTLKAQDRFKYFWLVLPTYKEQSTISTEDLHGSTPMFSFFKTIKTSNFCYLNPKDKC